MDGPRSVQEELAQANVIWKSVSVAVSVATATPVSPAYAPVPPVTAKSDSDGVEAWPSAASLTCGVPSYARVVEYERQAHSSPPLPGTDLVEKGIADLERGVESVESLLVSMGATRLAGLGIEVSPLPSPEHRLYERLRADEGDGAHSSYNSLVRRLVSFERAAECAG